MATLVLGAIGSAIGGGIGGSVLGLSATTFGGIIGTSIGSSIDQALFGSSIPDRTVEGPRLKDLKVQSSAYGAPIPLPYGTNRLSGNIIWSSGIKETRHQESETVQGGKGGGGSQTVSQVNFTYSVSLAIGISARPISTIGRIWADGKLLRDSSGTLSTGGELRIYTGDEKQLPDPLLEAHEGSGSVPAFRGLAYIVFEDLQLANFANRIPNFTFEIKSSASGSESLGEIIKDIAGRSDVPVQSDSLVTSINGFVITRPMSARAAIENLQTAYSFDGIETGNLILFRALPRDPLQTITEEELIMDVEKEDNTQSPRSQITISRGHETTLPREVVIHYLDKDRNYQPGAQRAQRLTSQGQKSIHIELPLVTSSHEAKRIAEIHLARAWFERIEISFKIPAKFINLDVGDVVTIDTKEPQTGIRTKHHLLIEKMDIDAMHCACSGKAITSSAFSSDANGDTGPLPTQNILPIGDTIAHYLNLPPLDSNAKDTARYYGAFAGDQPGWRGASIFVSTDSGVEYSNLLTTFSASIIGTCTQVLADGPHAYWDRTNEINVLLLRPEMTLISRPELSVFNGKNAALIGDEIIQFADVQQESDESYTLSNLLRGRRGTENAISKHTIGERFVLLESSSLRPIDLSPGAIGKPYLYKAVSENGALETTPGINFTYEGVNLRPLSPVHPRAARNAEGDITLAWIRRTRLGGEWLDGSDVPLNEEIESYEIDIISGATVIRTLRTTVPMTVYTVNDQITDFGSAQASLSLRIYQMSSLIGRGQMLEATL